MFRKTISSEFFMLWIIVVTSGELFDFNDKNDDESCSICYCSIYKTIVDCSRRGLVELPNGINSTVKKLNISFNEMTMFPKYLDRLYNLVLLDINSNHLNEIPEHALNNLTHLEILDLSKNDLESWNKLNLNYVLQPVINLKILNLSHNKFKTLSEQVLSPTIETLNLNNCEIEFVNGETSINGLINLKVLNLNNNPLRKINNLDSKSLQALYVSNCSLRVITDTEFGKLSSLIYLKMSSNYLLQLSTTSVISETVQYLEISQCNILMPSLQGFPNIRTVVLSHNMIRYLRSNSFMNNLKLKYLDLSHNSIRSIMADTFRGLDVLKYLDLSWNKIAVFPENSLIEMPSLIHLTLSRNYLMKVGHLESPSLIHLDLSSCRINAIEKDSLKGLPLLVNLNLSHNLITHIPDSISSNSLRHLILNGNTISFVNNLTFFMLPQLTSLSVIGNRFTNIWKRSYFQSNIHLETLELSDNMWQCDCKNENMFDFFKFVTFESNTKEDSCKLICNSTTNLVKQTWLEACYYTWYPAKSEQSTGNLFWLIIPMIIGICQCAMFVNCIRKLMKRCLPQEQRESHVEVYRSIIRQSRMHEEQEAASNSFDSTFFNDELPLPTYDVLAEQGGLSNAIDQRDLIPPPTYDEVLTMSQPPPYGHPHCQTGIRKTRRKTGRHKTKSSVDLVDEMERNRDVHANNSEQTELSDASPRRSHRSNTI